MTRPAGFGVNGGRAETLNFVKRDSQDKFDESSRSRTRAWSGILGWNFRSEAGVIGQSFLSEKRHAEWLHQRQFTKKSEAQRKT